MDRQVKQNKFKRNIYTDNCKQYKKLDAVKNTLTMLNIAHLVDLFHGRLKISLGFRPRWFLHLHAP